MRSYIYQHFVGEDQLQRWVDDPASNGMKIIAVYIDGQTEEGKNLLTVWWEIEDTQEN